MPDKYLKYYAQFLESKLEDFKSKNFNPDTINRTQNELKNVQQEMTNPTFHTGRDIEIIINEIIQSFDLDMYTRWQKGYTVSKDDLSEVIDQEIQEIGIDKIKQKIDDLSEEELCEIGETIKEIQLYENLLISKLGYCYAEAVAKKQHRYKIHQENLIYLYWDGEMFCYFTPTWGEPDKLAQQDYDTIPDGL